MHAEHHTGDRQRIDICIVDNTGPKTQVLGIEIKTVSASAQSSQLETYRQGLTEKYRDADIAIAYLTPFNRQRAQEVADNLPTIREFDEFAGQFPHARHVSWLDVAEIEWDGRDIWRQHQSYVRRTIAPRKKLKTLQSVSSRNRSFDRFFGEEAAGRFWEALAEIGIDRGENGAEIVLDNLRANANLLMRAFEILICDGVGVARSQKSDKFSDNLRQPFIRSPHRDFHQALFDLSRRFGNVWVKGERDYGIRVAHSQHSSGVSLVRSNGTDVLETGQLH